MPLTQVHIQAPARKIKVATSTSVTKMQINLVGSWQQYQDQIIWNGLQAKFVVVDILLHFGMTKGAALV